jgi:hypothetical protein
MRYLSNDYLDSQILNLGSQSEQDPYLVTQTGVDPCTDLPKTHMFVFGKITDVMATFGRLSRAPQIAHLPVDEEGLKTWLQRQEGQPPLETARSWAVNFRVRQQSRS